MPVPFEFDSFSSWYDGYVAQFLEPGRIAANKALGDYLDAELRKFERGRVRLTPGRVKGKGRTWDKINDPRYLSKISALEAIPQVIDDLVGLRIVCTNISDVQGVIDLMSSLPECDLLERPVLGRQFSSIRDYITHPKPTGYRAWHVNLLTTVSVMTDWHVIVCELQVRSLLQDSWGELTHEDIYKPTTTVSPVFGNVSLRMAELLVTLDDMAQDLRTELEKETEETPDVAPETGETNATIDYNTSTAPQLHNREAALQFLRRLGDELDRPVDLASLAWAVQREFGQEVARGWLGFGTFKAMLLTAVPSARLDAGPPATLLPANFVHKVSVIAEAKFAGIPDAILLLKRVDPQFPAIRHDDVLRTYEVLAQATAVIEWPDHLPDMRLVNELTRTARDISGQSATPLSRRPLNYVARSLQSSQTLRPTMTANAIAESFSQQTLLRLDSITQLTEDERQKVTAWLSM